MIQVYNSLEEFSVKNPFFTIGVFDGVHNGHRYLFGKLTDGAKEKGWTPVIMTFWPHPRIVLNGNAETLRYLTTLREKIQLMESLGMKHVLVLPFDEKIRSLSACDFVRDILAGKLMARGLLMGFNHRFGKDREGDYDVVRECSRKVNLFVERVEALKKGDQRISSTIIRDLLWSGDVEKAADLLGYTFFVTGMIVSGNKLGRNLGYPTANIQPLDEHKLLPKDGVYIAKAVLSGKTFYGMLNIGIRPTLKDVTTRKTIEVHLFDFHGDIYGQDVRVFFLKRIREELKFDDVGKLRNQLKKDHEFSVQWLKERNLY